MSTLDDQIMQRLLSIENWTGETLAARLNADEDAVIMALREAGYIRD